MPAPASKPRYALGIDFGTLSARAAVVDLDTGAEVAASVREYPHAVIERTLPGDTQPLEPETALQDPRDYLEVLVSATRSAVDQSGAPAESIVGIGIDFTSCTLLPTLKDGTPLVEVPSYESNPHAWAKLWKHHSAQPEADRINEIGQERDEAFVRAYGGGYSSEWAFSKILQTLHDAPEIYRAADRFIEAGDWIVWRLTGMERRSLSLAGFKAMAVYEAQGGPEGAEWTYPSLEFFSALHPDLRDVVTHKMDAPLLPLGARAGGLTPAMASRLGLAPDTPVAAANIDAHVATPACGVAEPGRMVMILGTSTCHLMADDRQVHAEGVCGVVRDGVLPGLWGYEAGQAGVGDIFAWFVDRIAPSQALSAPNSDPYDVLGTEAAGLSPGASGLLALDWWNGSRSVLMDTRLSGVLLGMTLSTRPAEIYRALIEATAFGARKVVEAFTTQGIGVRDLVACGGLAKKNPLLMQIYADVLNRPIEVAASEQTCALGAAMYGAVAAGAYDTIRDAADRMAPKAERTYEPNPADVSTYEALFREYHRMHDLLGRDSDSALKRLRNIRDTALGF